MPVIIDEHTQYSNNGASIVNGFVYIGKVNTDPTILANRLTLFSDAAFTIVVPNPQRTNARGQTLDGPIFTSEGSFSFELQNSGSVVIESIRSMGGTTGGLSLTTLFDVAGINAITAKGDPVVAAYIDKQQYSLTIISEPTGAMTLDIDGNGVVPIKNKDADIVTGQFPANGIIVVAFNAIGPVFELVSGANLSVPSPIGDVTPNSIQGTTIEGTTIKATTTFEAASGTTINEFSTDGTLAGNSDDAVPTEQAVKTFAIQKNANAVGQGDIATTTQDINTTALSVLIDMAGGEFAFWPTIRRSSGNSRGYLCAPISSVSASGATLSQIISSNIQLNRIQLGITAGETFSATQRYFQSSPPYDIGDGVVHSFIYAIVDNSSGKIESMSHAPDPTWANNGPTCIRSEYSRKGKFYRKNCVIDKTKDFQDPERYMFTEQEITLAFKNSDMSLIPHPFTGNDLTDKTIILIDPNDPIVLRAEEMKNAGENAVEELFLKKYVRIGNEHIKGRATPSEDVMVVKPKWKNTM